ncbi:hypothetical protein [Helicobacter sp. 16-1353]|uniref:hypothetical protein n=1 Tax=Helicobacter sp. 16-1353 TaxID=2004996 RepID=UPI0015EE7AEA|nr:hypothetical protein [Helicobacter sp. 16-1353]
MGFLGTFSIAPIAPNALDSGFKMCFAWFCLGFKYALWVLGILRILGFLGICEKAKIY